MLKGGRRGEGGRRQVSMMRSLLDFVGVFQIQNMYEFLVKTMSFVECSEHEKEFRKRTGRQRRDDSERRVQVRSHKAAISTCRRASITVSILGA